MVKSVKIKNFKSVVDASFEIGYFNVLIGENGCGKSNILEGIGFAAAAEAKKLDFEFLGSRGLRISNPQFMFSAFNGASTDKVIKIEFLINDVRHFFDLEIDPQNQKKWIEKNLYNLTNDIVVNREKLNNEIEKIKEVRTEATKEHNTYLNKVQLKEVYSNLLKLQNEINEVLEKITSGSDNKELSNFIIYSPEHSSLRKFEESDKIYPLGIKGEGIFQYLRELSYNKDNEMLLNEIRNNLSLLDWYDNFNVPENLHTNEYSLSIKDRYVDQKLEYFDQRSTNEGFLYLLFYSILIVSKETPTFFAIDNIDNALNPKLCKALISNLAALAKRHQKQIIITTHNPAILDGLDLKDDGQRLFVVRRNDKGYTKIKRIDYNANREMKLSEIWTKGYIGGLPENF